MIKKEEINPRVMDVVSKLGSASAVAKSIGKSAMVFTHIKNQQSLPALETIASLRIMYGISIDSIIDGTSDKIVTTEDYKKTIERINELEEENKELSSRCKLFQKIIESKGI